MRAGAIAVGEMVLVVVLVVLGVTVPQVPAAASAALVARRRRPQRLLVALLLRAAAPACAPAPSLLLCLLRRLFLGLFAAFPLHPPVLEPDLHLGLSEHQRRGHLEALGPGQVLVELELVLQFKQLLAGEGGARPAALPQEVGLRLGCGAQDVRLQRGSARRPLPPAQPAPAHWPCRVPVLLSMSVAPPQRTRQLEEGGPGAQDLEARWNLTLWF